MKNLLVGFVFTCFPGAFLAAQSQEELAPVLSDTFAIGGELPEPERVVYKMYDIEKPPFFPGGEKELLRFIWENLHFPPLARDSPIPGPMAVTFIVEADGSVTTKKILRGEGFSQVLMDMLDHMPRWMPGTKDGRAVAVQFTLPVRPRWE